MEARVKFLGHPVHQMLVVFPVGLLATGVVFDIIHWVGGSPAMGLAAHWMIVAGLIGALVAAPFGTADWLKIPAGTRAKAIGGMHGGGNLVVVALFALSWWLRREMPEQPPVLAHVLALAGGALALVTAWLGGELVSRLGVGVSDEASLDASNSLRHDATPATAHAGHVPRPRG